MALKLVVKTPKPVSEMSKADLMSMAIDLRSKADELEGEIHNQVKKEEDSILDILAKAMSQPVFFTSELNSHITTDYLRDFVKTFANPQSCLDPFINQMTETLVKRYSRIYPQAGDIWINKTPCFIAHNPVGSFYIRTEKLDLVRIYASGLKAKIEPDMWHGNKGWKLIFRDGKPH